MNPWAVIAFFVLFLLALCAFARASAPLGKRW